MTHTLFVDGELEESGLELSEAIALEEEILMEDPEAEVTIEPDSDEDEEDSENEDEDEDEVFGED